MGMRSRKREIHHASGIAMFYDTIAKIHTGNMGWITCLVNAQLAPKAKIHALVVAELRCIHQSHTTSLYFYHHWRPQKYVYACLKIKDVSSLEGEAAIERHLLIISQHEAIIHRSTPGYGTRMQVSRITFLRSHDNSMPSRVITQLLLMRPCCGTSSLA